MKILSDLCYCEEHKQYLDLYLPECESFPVFIYFHGGGLVSGDKGTEPVMAIPPLLPQLPWENKPGKDQARGTGSPSQGREDGHPPRPVRKTSHQSNSEGN